MFQKMFQLTVLRNCLIKMFPINIIKKLYNENVPVNSISSIKKLYFKNVPINNNKLHNKNVPIKSI